MSATVVFFLVEWVWIWWLWWRWLWWSLWWVIIRLQKISILFVHPNKCVCMYYNDTLFIIYYGKTEHSDHFVESESSIHTAILVQSPMSFLPWRPSFHPIFFFLLLLPTPTLIPNTTTIIESSQIKNEIIGRAVVIMAIIKLEWATSAKKWETYFLYFECVCYFGTVVMVVAIREMGFIFLVQGY